MNREFLVLIESEVESRDAWITKNEAEDVQDLEGFLQLKDAHDVSYWSYLRSGRLETCCSWNGTL